MSSRDKYGKFKKKDYLRVIRNTQDLLCLQFGYTIKPCLMETRLREGRLMEFYHCPAWYAIFYDYKQFKDAFGHRDFDAQEAYAAAMMAHEMRHYYQHRQMVSKVPMESDETLALWWENECNPKCEEDGCSRLEFHLQPLELDATLFEYVFCAEAYGRIAIQAIESVEHLNAVEKLYVEYFGETDDRLFNDKIREILIKRNADE